MRVGLGFDIHRTIAGRPLILGGVAIPCEFGLDGHSDADVLLHALIDAILGAAGGGDIGEWFPDTDPKWKGASSVEMLHKVWHWAQSEGWHLVNADGCVIAQKPKLSEYKMLIRNNVAALLAVSQHQINIKAKTHERLDALGRGEGISAQVVVLLTKEKPCLQK